MQNPRPNSYGELKVLCNQATDKSFLRITCHTTA